jgi:poly(hydroxyalkanoate) granule-associated protein
MAKLKKAARTKTASRKPAGKSAEATSHNLISTAQQIWAAGIGALARAQGEGTDMFDALVKKGMSLEAQTRKLANGRVDVVRASVEDRVENVREKATDTWDRMEKVFEDRVHRALTRLGVPTREDLAGLNKRVETLTAELRKQNGKVPVVKKAAAPVNKAAKKPMKKAAAVKKTGKSVLPKVPRPRTPKA